MTIPVSAGSEPRLVTWRAGVALIALWLGLALFFGTSPFDRERVFFGGDQALLLRAADDVLAGRPPLAGAYSKWNLHHPGPLFAYLLAPIQWATGKDIAATTAVVSLIQAGAVVGLALLGHRLSGVWPSSLAVPFLIVFNPAFVFYLRIVWNVSIITPFLAWALWLVCDDRRPAIRLPALAFVLCFVAQAHLAFMPVAICLGVLGTVRAVRTPGRSRSALVAAAAVVLACWAPVLWDAVTHRGGNAYALVSTLDHRATPHRLNDVTTALRAIVTDTLPAPGEIPWTRVLVACLGLVGLGGLFETDRSGPLRWFAVVLGAAWAVFFATVSRTPGQIETYYSRPVWILVAATLIGGVASMLSLLPGRVRMPASYLVAGTVVLVCWRPAITEYRRLEITTAATPYRLSEIERIARAIELDVAARGVPAPDGAPRRIHCGFDLGDRSGAIPAFVYVLERRRLVVSRADGEPRYRICRSGAPLEPGARELLHTDSYSVVAPG
jgi:hypothetical protein